MASSKRPGKKSVQFPASIVLYAPSATHACMVADVTPNGASLTLPSALVGSLPEAFDLSFDDCRTLLGCELVWQRRDLAVVTWRKTYANVEALKRL